MGAQQPDILRRTGISVTLNQCDVFRGLNPEVITMIASICTTRTLEKGEFLFRLGDTIQEFYIIQAGQIGIQTPGRNGDKQYMQFFDSLSCCAMSVIVSDEILPVNAEATKPTQLIVIPKEPFVRLYKSIPELSIRLFEALSHYFKAILHNLLTVKGRSIESRLASWLLQQVVFFHEETQDGFVLLNITKKALASQLGVASETLSRAFARFRDEGIIIMKRNKIILKHRKQLKEYVFGEG